MTTLQFLARGASRLAAVAIVVTSPMWAQITGTYTIDSAQPASATNFVTFADAVTALSAGIAGPVVFDVYNGVGPYTGFGITSPLAGSTGVNRIVFQAAPGQTPVVSGPATGNVQTIKLGTANTANTGPKYITLQGLTVTGAAAGAAILAAGCDGIVIANCVAHTSGSGIVLTQTPNSTVQDCEVYGVGMTTGTPGSATYTGGIALVDSSNTCVVQRNRIHDCSGIGFFMGGAGSATGQVRDNFVVNNAIWNCLGNATYAGGIVCRRATNSTLAYNSVSMPANSTQPGLSIQAAGSTTIVPNIGPMAEVSNNVVHHSGSGACINFDVTTALVPTIFDYNLYSVAGTGPVGKVATVNYTTLAAWQTLTAPNLTGKETNTIAGPAGFLNPNGDLHILPSSAALATGSVSAIPVVDDIDQQPRTVPPCRGADERTIPPLYAAFALPTTTTAPAGFGPLAFTISFVDQSQSNAPAGITSWAWDFNGDNVIDSNAQFPTYTYNTPGVYAVSLTVTDGVNGSDTLTRSNLITVQPYKFQFFTSGLGAGDLFISPVPNSQNPTATMGYMFLSFNTSQPVGTGGLFGVQPDPTSWNILLSPPAPGDLFHWYVVPGLFPNTPFAVPVGTLSFLAGQSLDGVQVDVSPSYTIVAKSSVSRVTF